MKFIAPVLMLIGGLILAIPVSPVTPPIPSGVLVQSYAKDKADKVAHLRELAGMTSASKEEKVTYWAKVQAESYDRNNTEVAKAATQAIWDGTESQLADRWENER